MENNKYIIFRNGKDYRYYLDTIYRNSVSDDKDIGEAIEFTDIDMARNICSFINAREGNTDIEDRYKVLEVSTQYKEV